MGTYLMCITGMDIKKTAIATYEATERCIHHLYLLQYRRGYIMLVTKNRSGWYNYVLW